MSANRSRPEQYQLRMPIGLRERIKATADANGRSLNAEIVATLLEAYPAPIDMTEFNGRLLEKIRSLKSDASAVQFAETYNLLSELEIEIEGRKGALVAMYEPSDPRDD